MNTTPCLATDCTPAYLPFGRELSKVRQSYTSKFAPRRDCPYLISKLVSPSAYQIVSPKDKTTPLGVYHTSALTPYVESIRLPEQEPLRPLRKRGRPNKKYTDEDSRK